MKIGNREFDLKNKTYIMGILNVTPDSFSDGGRWNDLDAARRHVEEMIAEGADIIDIGGESTRPGYTMLSDEEEIARVIPYIEMVKKHFDIPVSIDTYKGGVAKEALAAGADLVNDIWGLKWDDCLA
ncbi:MAG: dihydropteroate synthase, partial [Hominisplanchenecus sp.]